MKSKMNCSDDSLRLLLREDEQSGDYSAAARHVDSCPHCQQRIGELAAADDEWHEAREMLLADDDSGSGNSDTVSGHERSRRRWQRRPTAWTEAMARQLLSPPSHPEMLGRIGRYEVERLIGSGGMGVVFKAFDSELNRPVAVKLLAPYLAGNGAARRRFAREARAAAAVVHEHVVAIHNVETDGEVPFLVMQYVPGESLQSRLDREAPLGIYEILRIGMQIAAGLAAAHAQGLVHRDVKPSNVLLEKGVERSLLTDFGLARAGDDTGLTLIGHHPGTPQYMSPEQARGEALDGRSDLFGLGCMLYEMATGVSPFRTDSTIATLRRIVDEQPAAMASIVPELPPWFCHIVERLLSKDPAKRFASASEVSKLLEQCLSHLQQPKSVPLPASLVPHATGRRSIFNVTRKGAIAMLGTMIGMTLLGMMLWQATEAPDISGQWTSNEWGTVVLVAKGPGEYQGTFTGSAKDNPAPRIDPRGSGLTDNNGGGVAMADIDKNGRLKLLNKNGPAPLALDFPGLGSFFFGISDGETGRASDGIPSSTKTGTLHLKWSRVERRYNGTWGKGADRSGAMSLRLVDNELRGGWTTDEDVQLETGTPLIGDLSWKRSKDPVGKAVNPSSSEGMIPPPPFDEQRRTNPTPNRLQGKWEYISVEADGVVTEYTPASSQVLTITGDLWKMNNLMVSANRVEIDGRNLTFHGKTSQGPSSGVGGDVPSIAYGIYSLDGDTLAICMTAFEVDVGTTAPGIGGPYIKRPQTFETKGTKNLVYRLRRAVAKGSANEQSLDRNNARAVAEAFVAAAIAGRIDEAASLIDQTELLAQDKPAFRSQIEAFSKRLNRQQPAIKSVYVNDPVNPMTALAASESLKLVREQSDDGRDFFLIVTLTMSNEGWLVTDVELESEQSIDRELKKFFKANPKSISVAPQALIGGFMFRTGSVEIATLIVELGLWVVPACAEDLVALGVTRTPVVPGGVRVTKIEPGGYVDTKIKAGKLTFEHGEIIFSVAARDVTSAKDVSRNILSTRREGYTGFFVGTASPTGKGRFGVEFSELLTDPQTGEIQLPPLEFHVVATAEVEDPVDESGHAWFPIGGHFTLKRYEDAHKNWDHLKLPIEKMSGDRRLGLVRDSAATSMPWDGSWHVEKCELFADPDNQNAFRVDVTVDSHGGELLRKLTSAHQGERLAVVVEERIVVAPTIRSSIENSFSITGTFTKAEAQQLVQAIRRGMKRS